ncbi:MAG: DUF6468 domain-containing protein [Kiloniellaceae bacterium]
MSGAPTMAALFDAVIAILLVATIVYAVVLNRKLSALRDTKADMEALIARLVESTERAQGGLDALKEHAQQAGGRLQRTADSARALADELAYLVEVGGSLASRLDGAIGAVRARSAAPAAMPAPARAAGAGQGEGAKPGAPAAARPAPGKPAGPGAPARPSPQEAKLLEALQGMR